jgi:hypothetical protein
MIRHVALFTFTDEATDEDVRAIDEGLGGLPGVVDEILSYSFGRDLGLGDGTYDYAVVGEFDSAEDFHAYSAHPEHVRVLTTCIKPILKDVVRVQIEV